MVARNFASERTEGGPLIDLRRIIPTRGIVPTMWSGQLGLYTFLVLAHGMPAIQDIPTPERADLALVQSEWPLYKLNNSGYQISQMPHRTIDRLWNHMPAGFGTPHRLMYLYVSER